MREIARVLSVSIAILFAPSAFAQPTSMQDATPCRKVAAERIAVPDDFTLTYRAGPVHASWGGSSITIVNASGLVAIKEIQRSKGRRGPRQERTSEKQISKQAVRRLYATVQACGFFDLDKSYWNKRVMDGSVSSMEITAGGKKHQVIVHHFAVERFRTIASALSDALDKK